MALGYEGIGIFDGAPFLVTGMGVPLQRQRIDSGSAFRGSAITDKPLTEAISSPHSYDWPVNEGSFSWDTTPEFFDGIYQWLVNRADSKEISFYPCVGAFQEFLECYWTSMSFEATENSLVTGTCNFTALNRDNEAMGNDYINNRLGAIIDGGTPATVSDLCEIIRVLNPGGNNTDPLPFWKTTIESSELLGTPQDKRAEVISWSLNFNQEVTKNFMCSGSSTEPVEPDYIGIGPLTVEVGVVLYVTVQDYVLPEVINNMKINVGTGSFNFTDLELQQYDQPLQTGSDLVTITTSFSPYGMTADAG